MNLFLIEVNQQIGTFYIGKINSSELIKISTTIRRDKGIGIQRILSKTRVNEIAKYCKDPDATFPTPIILVIKTDDVVINEFANGIFEMKYNNENVIAEIIDGQHRIEGIKISKMNFEIPIVIMFDLTEEEKAYVFSTINSNQTKVDKSLIYDLFDLSKKRSPYKTCHEIARIMNSSPNSAFYNKLKMLGKKANDKESLSQGTFVEYLCKLISKKPKEDMINIKNGKNLDDDNNLPLRKYFINDQDEIILKILENYFGAVKEVFNEEWENPDEYILSKTTGYGGLLKAFKEFYNIGINNKTLNKEFFIMQFNLSKAYLKEKNKTLTSKDFPSNEHMQKKLADLFLLKYKEEEILIT